MLLLCQSHLNAVDNLQLKLWVSLHVLLEHWASLSKQVFTEDGRVTCTFRKYIAIEIVNIHCRMLQYMSKLQWPAVVQVETQIRICTVESTSREQTTHLVKWGRSGMVRRCTWLSRKHCTLRTYKQYTVSQTNQATHTANGMMSTFLGEWKVNHSQLYLTSNHCSCESTRE